LNCLLNRAAPNYKNSHPLVIPLRLSLYRDRTLGERIRKWRLERALFQRDLAKIIGVDEMTIVNWEKGGTKPTWDEEDQDVDWDGGGQSGESDLSGISGDSKPFKKVWTRVSASSSELT